MIRVRRACALLALGVMAGCVSPVPLVLKGSHSPDRGPGFAPKVHYGESCAINFLSLADQRSDKDMLGNVAGRAVHAPPDAGAWLRNALGRLEQHGFKVGLPGTEPVPGVSADLRLLTAWITGISTSKAATVVLEVGYHAQDGSIIQRRYRGGDVSSNWKSGDGEIQMAMGKAFDQALDQLAADAAALCAHPDRLAP